MAEKSRVLIIGATGYIGKFIVEASAKTGHPTFALVRESTISENSEKRELVESFKNSGATLVYGDIHDRESLVKAVKQVDVVISSVGYAQLADQVNIVTAIKEAGNVKRFLPSEFGNDADRTHEVEPLRSIFQKKCQIRRAIERERIPYTIVIANYFDGYFLHNLTQFGLSAPPRDRVTILGHGDNQAVFNKEEDIAAYTIRAIDDQRTLNKILYISPPKNTLSFNQLVDLWERKIGEKLKKVYLDEQQVLENIEKSTFPTNVVLAINHSVLLKGDQTNFQIKQSFGVEASELYPDVMYTTVDEYLDQFV